jgi:hypothetical protein
MKASDFNDSSTVHAWTYGLRVDNRLSKKKIKTLTGLIGADLKARGFEIKELTQISLITDFGEFFGIAGFYEDRAAAEAYAKRRTYYTRYVPSQVIALTDGKCVIPIGKPYKMLSAKEINTVIPAERKGRMSAEVEQSLRDEIDE